FLYRNAGTATKPVLAPPTTLFAEPLRSEKGGYAGTAPQARDVGGGLTPFVVDWDGDGKLDLLFGDQNRTTTEQVDLTEAEKALAATAHAKLEQLRAEMQKLTTPPENESAQERDARETKLAKLRIEMVTTSNRAAKFQAQKTISHGFLWLMLRKPAAQK